MDDLLARDLVVVTGKGGVGKSTVAAALGLAAARRGRRTIVAEVARRDDVSRALGGTGVHARPGAAGGGPGEDELAPGLHHLSIDPEDALDEYLVEQLPTVGKAWELAQPARRSPGADPYDLVVLDAPATGHGVAVLAAPRTFAEITRVGRVARQ